MDTQKNCKDANKCFNSREKINSDSNDHIMTQQICHFTLSLKCHFYKDTHYGIYIYTLPMIARKFKTYKLLGTDDKSRRHEFHLLSTSIRNSHKENETIN